MHDNLIMTQWDGNDNKKTRVADNNKMDAIKLGVIYLGRNFGKVWSLDTFDTHAHTHTYINCCFQRVVVIYQLYFVKAKVWSGIAIC